LAGLVCYDEAIAVLEHEQMQVPQPLGQEIVQEFEQRKGWLQPAG
jgi:hypothetical protein